MNYPSPLPWQQRHRSVYPLPGGYSGYLETFKKIAFRLDREEMSIEQLSTWMVSQFKMSAYNAKVAIKFLLRVGLVEQQGDSLVVDSLVRKRLAEKNDEMLIVILHSRVKFVGEMLYELRESKTLHELADIAGNYGLNWQTTAQVQRRRGWLQSAKLVELRRNKLELTRSGRSLVSELKIHIPDKKELLPDEPLERVGALETQTQTGESLAKAIVKASTRSDAPTEFEKLVTKAFLLMGFDAEHIGTAGNTDVLVRAYLGRIDSFRVCVDAKTTSSGSLKDSQVDWLTLSEHRTKHEVEFSLLVAPNPSGSRLLTRSQKHSVAVLSAEQLAELCLLHAKTPLSLHDYKTLFATSGRVDLTEIVNAKTQVEDLQTLVEILSHNFSTWTKTFGRMSARDIELTLVTQEGMHISIEDIEYVLNMLSHPLVGLMYRFESTSQESPHDKYVLATNREAAGSKVQLLANMIGVIGS